MAIKIAAIEEPKYEIELPDGSLKTYDLWPLAERVYKAEAEAGEMTARNDAVRAAFGFPTLAGMKLASWDDYKAAPPAAQQFTLSPQTCSVLSADVTTKVAELPHLKKLRGLLA